MKATQKQQILEYMQRNGGITPAEAYEHIGCLRLAARIHDLRVDGHDIVADIVGAQNRHGEKVYFTRYRLRRAV